MTDRELLELAAKAAEINTIIWTESPRSNGQTAGCIWNGVGHGDTAELWNPLTDDGDALRLAVKLKLKVYQGDLVAIVHPRMSHAYIAEEYERNGDHYAATRRAIVHAAAEIVKAMP